MIEYYRVLILVYIFNLLVLLIGSLNFDNISRVKMHWYAFFAIFIMAFVSPVLMVKPLLSREWIAYTALSIWVILLSAPLGVYICDNLSISINWG